MFNNMLYVLIFHSPSTGVYVFKLNYFVWTTLGITCLMSSADKQAWMTAWSVKEKRGWVSQDRNKKLESAQRTPQSEKHFNTQYSFSLLTACVLQRFIKDFTFGLFNASNHQHAALLPWDASASKDVGVTLLAHNIIKFSCANLNNHPFQ